MSKLFQIEIQMSNPLHSLFLMYIEHFPSYLYYQQYRQSSLSKKKFLTVERQEKWEQKAL